MKTKYDTLTQLLSFKQPIEELRVISDVLFDRSVLNEKAWIQPLQKTWEPNKSPHADVQCRSTGGPAVVRFSTFNSLIWNYASLPAWLVRSLVHLLPQLIIRDKEPIQMISNRPSHDLTLAIVLTQPEKFFTRIGKAFAVPVYHVCSARGHFSKAQNKN